MNQEVLKQKSEIVSTITEDMKNAGSVIVVEYRGLDVAKLTKLRRQLRDSNASMFVFKNTLVSRAAEGLGHADLMPYLEGPNAIVFSKDISEGPKILTKFSKANPSLVIKAGIVEGKVFDAAGMKVIATLPNRDGLISMFLSVLQAPVRQFACTLKAVADK
ncbi:MAG: 50S ribosomal protein L10 [Bacilli bacterium]